jgi:3,4-dihydroxy-2-butanone 4-phosphate synthase
LWGDNYKEMINANFSINIDDKGTFTGVAVGDRSFLLDEWNKQFKTQSTR